MIELAIPGRGVIRLEALVCDVNGTLAVDGRLIDGVGRALGTLRDRLEVYLITADTHGRQAVIDQQLNLKAVRLVPSPLEGGRPDLSEAAQKAAFVRQLGAGRVAAIGQGANDAEMLREAALGIALQSREGLAVETLLAADLVTGDILSALELLDKPMRLVATLRK